MNQRRRHSPAVYRRRRLVAALLAVFVLALVVWGARGLIDTLSSEDAPEQTADSAAQTQDDDGDDADATEEPEPTDTAAGDTETHAAADEDENDDDAQEDPEDLPEGSCAPGDIEVRASTNQESYGSGVAPLLIMEIENTGSEECTLDVGTAEQVFRVSHGDREVFNTAQCGSTGNSLEMEFEPGQSEQAHLTWPRSDSSTDCTEPAELITGDYELTVAVSGLSSDPYSFHITGVEP